MTRMWMGSPASMCRQHLLGEHKEIHQLLGSLKKGLRVDGYVRNNCIEVSSIKERHDLLVEEMKERGYNHHSEMIAQKEVDIIAQYLPESHRNAMIDVEASDSDRFHRCEACRSLKINNNRITKTMEK